LLKQKFGRQGNGFLSGKFMDNHIYKALQYVKHDESCTYKTRGSGWQSHLDAAPDWDHGQRSTGRLSRKRPERDPLITYSNVLWRARAHREEHNIASTDLGVVLEHLTRTTNWTPSVDLMRKGLDVFHHKLFAYQVTGKVGKTPDWWTPKIDTFRSDLVYK